MYKSMYKIVMRQRILVNTYPQSRCYTGAYAKSELRWSEDVVLDYCTEYKVEEKLQFWRELNDYAVSQRGESARSEFRAELVHAFADQVKPDGETQ